MSTLLATTAGGLVVFLIFLWLKPGLRLPPGPRRLPIIGNIHQFPKDAPWQVFDDWHRRYGPILCLRLGPRTVISLGNHAVAKELFGRRGRLYASKPRLTSARDAITGRVHTALLPYGDRWRCHNRIQLSLSSPSKVQAYREIIDNESLRTLCRLLEGRDLRACFARYTASVLWTLLYGRPLEWEDLEFTEMQSITSEFVRNMTSPNWVQETFPFVGHLLDILMPGRSSDGGFHHRASRFFASNFESALQTRSWNFCKHVHQTEDTEEMTPAEVSYMLGVLLEASIDSTAAVLEHLVVALIQYPDAARKAQNEIDSIVGTERLPGAADMPRLPYTQALLREVLRWRPITPQGVPHASTEADTYGGYYIPKDSIVMFNQWSAQFDDTVFEHAQSFDPDRWIKNPDLPLPIFGVGRRSCPGQNVARATLNTLVPRLLWAFRFEPVDSNFSSDLVFEGALLQPKNLGAMAKARSPAHGLLLQQRLSSVDQDADACLCRVQSVISVS